jgi:hypothetical protein
LDANPSGGFLLPLPSNHDWIIKESSGLVNLILYKSNGILKMAKKKQHGGKRVGAGRKPSPEGKAIVLAVSVPETLLESLDAHREAKQWSRSQAVVEAIRGLLRRGKVRA